MNAILIVLCSSTLVTADSSAQQSHGRIVFYSTRHGNNEIYTVRPDGGDLRRITNNDWDDVGPAWSPDGSRIAFVSQRDGNREIYVMNADGSNQRRLTNTPEDESHPAWSPDGNRIGFFSERDGNREGC